MRTSNVGEGRVREMLVDRPWVGLFAARRRSLGLLPFSPLARLTLKLVLLALALRRVGSIDKLADGIAAGVDDSVVDFLASVGSVRHGGIGLV